MSKRAREDGNREDDYTPEEAAAALWRLYTDSGRTAQTFATEAAVCDKIRRIASKNPAALRISRSLIDGAKWPDAAENVLFRASFWLHGVGNTASDTLLKSSVWCAKAVEWHHNNFVLNDFVENFEFFPANVKLLMLPVSSQMATLTAQWRDRRVEERPGRQPPKLSTRCELQLQRMLQQFPFTPPSCFKGAFEDVAKRVLVSVAWQKRWCNAEFPPLHDFMAPFCTGATEVSHNRDCLDIFLRECDLREVNVAGARPVSLEWCMMKFGSCLFSNEGCDRLTVRKRYERGAHGSMRYVVCLTTCSSLLALREMKGVVGTVAHVEEAVYTDALHAYDVIVVLRGDASVTKTYYAIAVGSSFGYCVYLRRSESPRVLILRRRGGCDARSGAAKDFRSMRASQCFRGCGGAADSTDCGGQ